MTKTTLVDAQFRINQSTKKEIRCYSLDNNLKYSDVCRKSLIIGFEKILNTDIVVIEEIKNIIQKIHNISLVKGDKEIYNEVTKLKILIEKI